MAMDKFSATWVSHSSLADFARCPRAYYLKNVYKSPKTGHKIQVMTPALALGQAVHEVLESLSVLPTDERFNDPLPRKFESAWEKLSGKKGGFTSPESERRYRARGEAMISRVVNNPGLLKEKAVKIKEDLPYYWISEEDNIILCGKIDWLKYLPEDDSVHIVDFKTSKKEEDQASLQLPIYHLLVHNCQKRNVSGASYWYLDFADVPTSRELPDLNEAREMVLTAAKRVKLARQLQKFDCPLGGCSSCLPLEAVLAGKGELVGVSQQRDTYILPDAGRSDESVIL